MEHKEITNKEADKIIETREPRGLFWLKEDEWYVAIDNSNGDAWTEDFSNKEQCFKYLNGDSEE